MKKKKQEEEEKKTSEKEKKKKKDEDEEHKDSKSQILKGTINISDDKDGPEKENIQKSNLPNTSFIATDEQLNEKDKDIIFCPSLLKP